MTSVCIFPIKLSTVYKNIVIFWCIVKIFKECYISVLLSSRKNEILPDIHDIEGAARGIAKLWDRYRLVF